MADLITSGGREVTVNLDAITVREYRALFDRDQEQSDEDIVIAKAAGLTVEELLDLSQPDYRRVIAAFFKKAREPLNDPNFPGASTSP
jgi:hypothetical protein